MYGAIAGMAGGGGTSLQTENKTASGDTGDQFVSGEFDHRSEKSAAGNRGFVLNFAARGAKVDGSQINEAPLSSSKFKMILIGIGLLVGGFIFFKLIK